MGRERFNRLPIQAENFATLYPNGGELSLGESARNEEILELVNSTQEVLMKTHEIAGKSLTHSKALMKKQHDKRLNPCALTKIEKGDEVLIENVYLKKRGGNLEDKWLGPYPVDKVYPTNFHVCRNKRNQLVKTSKAKLWNKQSLKSLSSKRLRLDFENRPPLHQMKKFL